MNLRTWMTLTDHSIPDGVWWFNEYSEFEDFVGIGHERVLKLAHTLRFSGVQERIIDRLFVANGMEIR